MLENKFKTGLVKELKKRFPGCTVVHLDPNEVQGHPDLLVLYGPTWAALEGKKSANAPHIMVRVRLTFATIWLANASVWQESICLTLFAKETAKVSDLW